MYAFKEPPQSQNPPLRPLRPRLANPQSTSPRRSPIPRVAANASSSTPPPIAPFASRRPPAANTVPARGRASPSSGRSTPVRPFVAASRSPHSPVRLAKTDGTRNTPTATVARSGGNVASPLGLTMTRPGVARVLTTASMPSLKQDQRPIVSKQDTATAGNQPAPPSAASRPILAQTKSTPQRPAITKSRSFFHADEIPARSPSPDLAPYSAGKPFVYANDHDDQKNPDTTVQEIVDTMRPALARISSRHTEESILKRTSISGPKTGAAENDNRTVTSSTAAQAEVTSRRLSSNVTNTAQTEARKENTDKATSSSHQANIIATSYPRRVPSVGSTASSTAHQRMRSISSVTSSPSRLPVISATSRPSSSLSNRNDRRTSIAAPHTSVSTPPTTLSQLPQENLAQPEEETDLSKTTTQDDSSNPNPKSLRHERKLLDLEISNSSLLALNRSLEREVVKQKTELRRLRRATRGRLSIDATSSNFGEEGLSELGSLDENEEDQGDVAGGEEGGDSPSRRKSRKSSTFLDLAKQKVIVADNHRLNLALQRCVSISDTLIRDGDKALEYNVHYSEIAHVVEDATPGLDASPRSFNHEHDLADKEEGEEDEIAQRRRQRSLQQEMYNRQAEADALIRAWQGLGVGGVNTSEVADSPATHLEHGKDADAEADAEVEDRDSGVDLSYAYAYSGRSSRMGLRDYKTQDSMQQNHREKSGKVAVGHAEGTRRDEEAVDMF